MFDIITKEEYWGWLESGVMPPSLSAASWSNQGARRMLHRLSARLEPIFRPSRPYRLKDVQDVFIMSRLGTVKGKRILEVGGGVPRVLRWLSEQNETWLIDEYAGVGSGPRRAPSIPGINFVQGYVGEFIPELPAGYFDFIFSVSVVEHVPIDALESFFADCARLLKASGQMFHAIDIYLFDANCENLSQPFREKLHAYLRFAERPDLGIRLLEGEARIDEDLSFSCSFATQPDNVLREWHLRKPQEKRLNGQVVSIKSGWEKVTPLAQETS